jgi:hypothetical protein
VLADEFKDTQQGTLHFRYLLSENGGFLRVARSLPDHARQLAETLASPDIGREACERFVRTFIRPHGVEVPATPILVDALEGLAAAGQRAPVQMPLALYPLRLLLWAGGALAMYGNPGRIRGKVRKQLKIRAKERKKRRRAKKVAQLALARDARSEMPRSKVG